MPKPQTQSPERTIGIRMPGTLLEEIEREIEGQYKTISEHVRDLARQDVARRKAEAKEAKA